MSWGYRLVREVLFISKQDLIKIRTNMLALQQTVLPETTRLDKKDGRVEW